MIPTHIEAFAAAIAFWSFLLFNWSNFRFAMFCCVKGTRSALDLGTTLVSSVSYVHQANCVLFHPAQLDWPVGVSPNFVEVDVPDLNWPGIVTSGACSSKSNAK